MDTNWKDVVGYEGLYLVNEWGEIWSNYYHKKLKYSISQDGYKQYNLHKNHKAHIMTAHKAVAMAFVPNPNKLPLINHKDENKLNCYYKNLEWCTHQYNNLYNNKNEKIATQNREKYGTEFYVYDLNLCFLGKFKGTRKYAKEHGISSGNFSSTLHKNKDGIKKHRCKKCIPSLVPLKDIDTEVNL